MAAGIYKRTDQKGISSQVEQLRKKQTTLAKWFKDQMHVVEARVTQSEKPMKIMKAKLGVATKEVKKHGSI